MENFEQLVDSPTGYLSLRRLKLVFQSDVRKHGVGQKDSGSGDEIEKNACVPNVYILF